MKFQNSRMIQLVIWILILCFNAQEEKSVAKDDVLILKWNKAYADDDIAKSTIGLRWALSYMGAAQPDVPAGMDVSGENIIIHIDALGFSDTGLSALKSIHIKIRRTEEYKLHGNVDLGRYVTLLLGAPEHYYRITGTPGDFGRLTASYMLLPEMGMVSRSGISHQHRSVRFSKPDGNDQLLIATELDSITGKILEYETIELMQNGQPRFGIYNPDGTRRNFADPAYTDAGKPAKCMWCHESSIQPMYNPQRNFPGYLTCQELQDRLMLYNKILYERKLTLSGIDFSQRQDHTLSELLYISFMEPSAERLSREWEMPMAKVTEILKNLPTHVYSEFSFLGDLYNRTEIEKFSPYHALSVSGSVREPSEEVNHIN